MNEESKPAKSTCCQVTGQAEDDYGQSLCEMMSCAFRGRGGWLAWVAWIEGIAFTVIAVVAAVQAIGAVTREGKVLWASAFALSVAAIVLIKTWFWMLMFRNTILRAIRRLELKLDEALNRCCGD